MSNQELIVVKQLPIIEQKLKQISEDMDKQVEEAKSLVCTEESKQIIKNRRTELRKLFERLENERKTAKEQIMKPYVELDTIYKEYITDKFNQADNEYKNKINVIETEQKKKLEEEARRYFEEYRESKSIDFIKFENIGLKIGVSDNPTKLKKQVTAFIDKIEDDLKLIEMQEHKAEILVEYKQTRNVSQAITTVMNRFKAIEEEKKKQEEEKIRKEEVKKRLIQQMVGVSGKESAEKITQEDKNTINNFIDRAVEKDTILQAPVEEKQEDILILKFTVRGSRTKLRELKEFLEKGKYDYE